MYVHQAEKEVFKNPHLAHDDNVAFASYNRNNNTIITVSERHVKIWDAHTGVAQIIFSDISPDPITACTLDKKGRRFFLGTHDGSLRAYSYATGALVAEYEPHKAEVTFASHEESFFITGSWDTSTRFYTDEEHADAEPREKMYGQDQRAVACGTSSEKLCLVVTGDGHDTINVFDTNPLNSGKRVASIKSSSNVVMDDVSLKDMGEGKENEKAFVNYETDRCIARFVNPATSEITALQILAPWPAVVATSAAGMFSFWTLRPYVDPWKVYSKWRTFLPRAIRQNVHAVVNAMTWQEGEDLLYAGDDHGFITCWDLSEIIQEMNMLPSEFPAPP
eukprot:gene10169-3157_t